MMEYSCFDFRPLGVEKKVSMLEDFVHFVDDEFDFSSFADVLETLQFSNFALQPCFYSLWDLMIPALGIVLSTVNFLPLLERSL